MDGSTQEDASMMLNDNLRKSVVNSNWYVAYGSVPPG